MTDQAGREDHSLPLMSPATKAWIAMGGFTVVAAGMWHLAVFLTVPGVGLGDVDRTIHALVTGHVLPVTGVGSPPQAATVTVVLWLVIAVVLFAVLLAVISARSSRRAHRRRGKGLAERSEIREHLGVERVRTKASQTRPSLTERERMTGPVEAIGLVLGRADSGDEIVIPVEDHVAVVANTGAGKSSMVMAPAAITAPGALVLTLTRPDLLDVIAAPRARQGRLWVFDPLERAAWPEPMVWDPVAGCEDGRRAQARALAFVAGLGADDRTSTNSSFFRQQAGSALTRLLHAAALDPGRSIVDVLEWALTLDNGAETPQEIIRRAAQDRHPTAEALWAGMLRSVATGADETVSSTRQTLQQAVEPLIMQQVLRWVTPTEGVPVFDPVAFVASTDTLVLLADDNAATNVAPLCAMLLQEVVDAAKQRASLLAGGRLDPPMRIVGDEIANVAPVPKLPEIGSDARGFGLQLILALQSLGQARKRWGADGVTALMDQMAAEVLLGGISDPDTLSRYATLVGEVELTRVTVQVDPHTGRATSAGEQLHDRKVLRPDEVRRIEDRQALLLYRNRRALVMHLTPWWERPDGTQLSEQARATEARRHAHARSLVP